MTSVKTYGCGNPSCCCYTSKHRNPLGAARKELDCSHYAVAYNTVTGEYIGVDNCPKRPLNTIYKDNYASSCLGTRCDPNGSPAVCYPPVIRRIQNRNGYINENYNYSSKQYLQRRNRLFRQLEFNFLTQTPIKNSRCANFPTAQQNSIAKPTDNSNCNVDCYVDCSRCDTVKGMVSCYGYSPCDVKNNNCCAVYKPSNRTFSKQGAVSGGSRINRLKYQTVLKSQSTYKVRPPPLTSANTCSNALGTTNTSGNINAVNGTDYVMKYRNTGPTFKKKLGGFCSSSARTTRKCGIKKMVLFS